MLKRYIYTAFFKADVAVGERNIWRYGMDRAIKSTRFEFVDMRATTTTEKFVNDDYTVADVGDIKRYLGVEDPDELLRRMKERLACVE